VPDKKAVGAPKGRCGAHVLLTPLEKNTLKEKYHESLSSHLLGFKFKITSSGAVKRYAFVGPCCVR
jgi:hypothetical protein